MNDSANLPQPQTHRYGGDSDQVADLWLPDPASANNEAPHPVAVLLHGGFWRRRYNRHLMDPMAADLARRGWASWNVEYRRGPGSVQRSVADVRAALAALRALDAPLIHANTVVIGHSAGGHLALLTAKDLDPRLVISLGGVCDLFAAANADLGPGAAHEYVGRSPQEAPELYEQASPLAQLPSGLRAVLLVHGDEDSRVPISQSWEYVEAARRAGDPCELLELPGEDHFDLIAPGTGAYEAWAVRLA